MPKAKVFVDLERLRAIYTGLGQVAFRLGEGLSKSSHEFDFTFLVPKEFQNNWKNCSKESPYFWDKYFLKSGNFNVWHVLHQDSYYFPKNKTPTLLTLHDLNFLRRDEYSVQKKNKKLSELQRRIDKADFLTFISHFTANEVAEKLDISGKKQKIIYMAHAIPEKYTEIEKNEGRLELQKIIPHGLDIEQNYIFSIGQLHKRKNFHTVFPLLKHNSSLNFCIAGEKLPEYTAFILSEAKKMGVEKQLFLLGNVSTAAKNYLYEHCQAFVFPSLAEGFGLPVIEAMYFKKPVFLSKEASLPEVGADIAFYWNDFSPSEMVTIFEEGMKIFSHSSILAEKSKIYASQFNFAQTVQNFLNIYRELAVKD